MRLIEFAKKLVEKLKQDELLNGTVHSLSFKNGFFYSHLHGMTKIGEKPLQKAEKTDGK